MANIKYWHPQLKDKKFYFEKTNNQLSSIVAFFVNIQLEDGAKSNNEI